jgi:hypothetical protein
MRNLQEQLDERVNELGFSRHAVEHEQRETDLVGVACELPRVLGRRAPPKAFHELRMKRLQNARWQSQLAQPVELLDLPEEALEPHPSGVCSQPLEGSVVGEELVEPTPRSWIKPREHVREDAFVVSMTRRADDAIEAVVSRAIDLRLQQPAGRAFIQSVGVGLVGERFRDQPRPELGFGNEIERCDPEIFQDLLAMPATRAVIPVIAVECRW